jgi:hypothetical protein
MYINVCMYICINLEKHGLGYIFGEFVTSFITYHFLNVCFAGFFYLNFVWNSSLGVNTFNWVSKSDRTVRFDESHRRQKNFSTGKQKLFQTPKLSRCSAAVHMWIQTLANLQLLKYK